MISMEAVQEKLIQLKSVLKDTKRLFILTHDNPDPDSLSSAAALKFLVSEMYRVNTSARYNGIVGRAENREMIRLLDLKIKMISRNEIQPKDAVALVDCQPHTGNVTLPPKIKPLIVIDHHPLRKTTKCSFSDVRSDYGASATILGEYLLASGLEVPSFLATALCYGISSETQRLGRETTQNDMHTFSALFTMSNKRLLSKIENPKLPPRYFRTLNRALHHAYLYKNAVVSTVGDIPEPDFVSIVADLLLRCERVSWSLVMGRYQDKILISVRTNREKVHAGNLLRRLLKKRGLAGGHGMMAGGQIPCGGMKDQEMDALEKEITGSFLKTLGYKEPGDMTPLLVGPDVEI